MPSALVPLALIFFLAACSSSQPVLEADAARGELASCVAESDDSCLAAIGRSDIEVVEDVTVGCRVSSSCHKGVPPILEVGKIEESTIGVPSSLFPEFNLVEPGQPEASYLLIILGEVDGPIGEIGSMPLGECLLCPEKRAAIRRWIEQLSP